MSKLLERGFVESNLSDRLAVLETLVDFSVNTDTLSEINKQALLVSFFKFKKALLKYFNAQ